MKKYTSAQDTKHCYANRAYLQVRENNNNKQKGIIEGGMGDKDISVS